jgi:hypothetical protein
MVNYSAFCWSGTVPDKSMDLDFEYRSGCDGNVASSSK